MELAYASTAHHRDVVFYLTADGNRAYFLCGGCVYSICRPRSRHPGEIAKFGLVVRGTGPDDRVVANYVRSELRRRGLSDVQPVGEHEVFLDSVCLLHPDVSTQADVINAADAEVADECLAQYLTSLRTSPGVVVTGVRVRTQDKTIELFELPAIVNSSSRFVYTPSPYAFALVQAHLPRLPASLERLAEGLFDGIPAPRPPLDRDPAAGRTDVLITGQRSACPIAGSMAGARGAKRTTVSEFVQVKHIDRVCRPDAPRSPPSPAALPRAATPGELWTVFFDGDRALGEASPADFLTPEEDRARRVFGEQAWKLFGSAGAPRPFLGAALALSPLRKLATAYYLVHREKRSPVFPTLVDIVRAHLRHRDVAVPPTDEPFVAESVNELFRDALALGAVAEQLLMFDVLPPREVAVGSDARADAEILLRIVAAQHGDGPDDAPAAASQAHVTFVGAFAELLYAGRGRLAAATQVARMTGVTSLVLAVGDVDRLSAFDRGLVGATTRTRVATYLAALLAAHLVRARHGQSV
ncbi:tegument protein UL21 [Macacine alphaherpesvirus 1]|uniref:Tegument protein UL21 n=2 Tax=Simplexvirus TaxID=10294 RepID=A0A1X9WF30_9ALPH|nr:tegument protein UL21 [Macacine alphaherpesvirus 1]ARS01658.1 tegument protein UL21 [Macacine alphaherpesvirus 2]